MASSSVVPSGRSQPLEIPDTLDLADRAALAIRGMLNTLDPALMTMYGLGHFHVRTPFLRHWSADIPLDPKLAEALPLLRLVSGSDFRADLEATYRAELLSRIDDGLYWDRFTPARPWRNIYNNSAELYGQGRDEDFASVWGVARMVRALAAWRAVNGADTAAASAALIRGLRRIAVDRDDYSFYPHRGGWHDGFVYPRSGWIDTTEATRDREGPEGSVTCFQGHQIYAAAQLHRLTGDPVARELAERVARYAMKGKFWGGTLALDPAAPDGARILPDAPFRSGAEYGHWPLHFHARAIALRGILYHALNVQDERAIEFVRSAYEFTWSQGLRRLGWINTHPPGLACEGCGLADLVGLAIRLTDAGAGDYWDDVDAIVRNQLAEQQLTDAAALAEFCARQPERTDTARYPAPFETTEDVINRSVGVFFGLTKPGMVTDPWVMHCCTGNASQAIYYAWEGALREETGAATVNLLLNRSGRTVDVLSHLPYEGRVDLLIKAPLRVAVRIPHWVELAAARLERAGERLETERVGRHLVVRGLRAGDRVTLTFPVRESAATYTVNAGTPAAATYHLRFRASTALAVEPEAPRQPNDFPLYRGRGLRTAAAPRRTVARFVADRIFAEW